MHPISSSEKRIILIVLLLGTFMSSLDGSIVNVSLPAMRKQFDCGIEDIQWVITAYMICFCVFIPLTGWLRDKIGFFRLYLFSLSLFTIGSFLCGLSSSLEMLIFSRVLQALGGGSLNPTALAILSTVFPAEERGKVIGWWGLGMVIGPALGPTLGGVLTHQFGWPSIFYVNIPIGIITLALVFKYMSFLNKRLATANRFDFTGFFFFILLIISLQYAINEITKNGMHSVMMLISLAISIISIIVFVVIESASSHPVIDLKIFRNSSFTICIIITIVRSAANFGGVFLIPFLFQGLMGFSELQSGLLLLPNSLTIAFLMPLAGRWADSHGPRGIIIMGLLLLSVSMFLYSALDVSSAIATILMTTFIRGIGLGLMVSPLNTATMNSINEDQISLASSLNSLTQQLGGSIGIGLLSFIHQKMYDHYFLLGYDALKAEHLGLKDCFYISMLMLVISIIPAYFIKPKKIVSKRIMVPEQ